MGAPAQVLPAGLSTLMPRPLTQEAGLQSAFLEALGTFFHTLSLNFSRMKREEMSPPQRDTLGIR